VPKGHALVHNFNVWLISLWSFTVKVKSKKRVTVSISKETKEFLDSIKHTGQSYEGLIRDLVTCWKRKEKMEEKK
jgi:hypothetical protein